MNSINNSNQKGTKKTIKVAWGTLKKWDHGI